MTVLHAGPSVPQSRRTSLRISGCVMTVTRFTPITEVDPASPVQSRNPRDVTLTEAFDSGRPHQLLGRVDTYARPVHFSSLDPTRADIDHALRAEAAKRGADAVVLIRYQSEHSEVAHEGKISASGYAVAFKP